MINIDFASLNKYLADFSYIEGYEPTETDLKVFDAINGKELNAKFVHLCRWHRHIGAIRNSHVFRAGRTCDISTLPFLSAPAPAANNESNDIDLFGDDEVDEEAERIKNERIAAYNAKKAAKPQIVAKSEVKLEVKPWDEETDMQALTGFVRAIKMDGLVWGFHELVDIAYGIKKLVVTCVVEDEKASVDTLIDLISEHEFVQSVDIISFNKI